DDDAERRDHRHRPGRVRVEVLAHAVLEQRYVDDVLFLGDANPVAEIADGRGRVAAAAQSGEGRHARIVPTAHTLFLHELQQPPLAHHRVGQVEARELDLFRAGRKTE